jgi:hypothetical protein
MIAGCGTKVPAQLPPEQESAHVVASASLHADPSGRTEFEHTPVPGLQVSVVQVLLSLQLTGSEPAHAPDWHESVCVHAFPSEQGAPLGAFGFEHTPVAVLQVPTRWQASLALQTIGFEPVHVPA